MLLINLREPCLLWNRFVDRVYVVLSTRTGTLRFSGAIWCRALSGNVVFFSIESRKVALVHALTTE